MSMMSSNDRLAIALVRQRYSEDGGAERFLDGLSKALGDARLEVSVVARSWPERPGMRVVRCDPPYVGRLWRDAGFGRAAQRALRTGEFALVQSHERGCPASVVRAGDGLHRRWLAHRAATLGPIGRFWQRTSLYHRWLLNAEARQFRHPELRAVICNSTMVRDELCEAFGINADLVHVVYNAVDCTRFRPGPSPSSRAVRARFGIGPQTFVALFVGSGFERKGVATFLRALALTEGVVGVIVGRDKKCARYRSLARRLGVEGRVHFAGRCERTEDYYAAANVFVLPTLYDPFPNAILEAMAAGLPVITSETCGARDLVVEGETGFLRPASDPVGIAECLARLSRDRAMATDLGSRARRAVEPLTEEALATQLLTLYRKLLKTPPS